MAEAPGVALGSLTNDPNFNFMHIFNQSNNDDEPSLDSPYNSNSIACTYMDENLFSSTYSNNCDLSILTLNIQSLPSKFTEFHEWISSLQRSNAEPDIICLQEIWQFPDHSLFNLPGYSEIIFKLRRNSVQGGGIGIYVKSGLKFIIKPQLSIFVDRVFESIFIEIQPATSPNFIVGSVYRPGNNPLLTATEQFAQFSDLFSNLCNELSSLSLNSYICGDINLDVLQFNSNTNVNDYVNLVFSYGFIQAVTYPTRISNNSATLIDHVLTNAISNSLESVIITTKISDHFPIIHFRKNSKFKSKPNFIETRDFSQPNCFASSPPYMEDKRMVLEHTHGLFIT
jgi:hypothetical protein